MKTISQEEVAQVTGGARAPVPIVMVRGPVAVPEMLGNRNLYAVADKSGEFDL